MGILSLISSLFLRCSSKVVINSILSESFDRSRGLFQGSILAPLLFDIFIDDLAVSLDNVAAWDPAPHSLLFADDVKIHHSNINIFQHLLHLTEVWAVDNDMIINVAKLAIVSPSSHNFFIASEPLPKLASYKYLSLLHSHQGIAWREHLSTGVSKAHTQLSGIATISQSWPP